MLKYRLMEDSDIPSIVNLWNKEVASKSIYESFDTESFKNKFINIPTFDKEGFIVCLDNDEVVAFGNANYNNRGLSPSETPGYITCIFVKEEYQRKKIGTTILKMLEDFLRNKGKTYVRCFYQNPVNFKWYVPGYDHHEHMGAPAVLINSPFYFLLSSVGYYMNGQQDAFHIDLAKYEMQEEIVNKIKENEKDGYHITIYDKNRHHGFKEFFDDLGNEGFRNSINYNLNRENPRPIVIVEKNGEILGFTGPIHTEDSGRSSLSGVAISPKCRGRGLGKTMFCYFVQKSKENGGKFMTLFTGSENKARNIYLYAGLHIVASFAILRKEL